MIVISATVPPRRAMYWIATMAISSSDEREGTSGATRIDVQANFYSDSRLPEEISEFLSLHPTTTADKGLWVGPRTGKVWNRPRNLWQLRSEPNVDVLKFSEHIDWMLSKLLPVRDRIVDLRASGDIFTFGLTCVVWSSGTGATLKLSPLHTEALAHLQLDLWFTFSDYGKED